jgi:hypothetical protein
LEYLHGEGKLHRDIKGGFALNAADISRQHPPHRQW